MVYLIYDNVVTEFAGIPELKQYLMDSFEPQIIVDDFNNDTLKVIDGSLLQINGIQAQVTTDINIV